MSTELAIAIEAAKKGAAHALKYFNTDLVIESKSDESPVTIADKETEEVIKQTILANFPDAKFVGEETGGNKQEKEYWIIDPIDGTKLFIRGIPMWSVLIGLVRENKVVLGVSFVPGVNELMYAEAGFGTFLNGKKVTVSEVKSVKDSFITYTEIPPQPDTGRYVTLIQKGTFSASFYNSYGYHLVANGRAECITDYTGKLWDIGPLKIIIEEAGGTMTNKDGSVWTTDSIGCVATNGYIHDEVMGILNQKV